MTAFGFDPELQEERDQWRKGTLGRDESLLEPGRLEEQISREYGERDPGRYLGMLDLRGGKKPANPEAGALQMAFLPEAPNESGVLSGMDTMPDSGVMPEMPEEKIRKKIPTALERVFGTNGY